MELLERLLTRLGFGQELPFQFSSKLTLFEWYDIHSQALPGSSLEVRTRRELQNGIGTLNEWAAIYRRSPFRSWVEELSLRRIRQARATDDEWHQVFLTTPAGGQLNRIAQQKMDSTSRS